MAAAATVSLQGRSDLKFPPVRTQSAWHLVVSAAQKALCRPLALGDARAEGLHAVGKSGKH